VAVGTACVGDAVAVGVRVAVGVEDGGMVVGVEDGGAGVIVGVSVAVAGTVGVAVPPLVLMLHTEKPFPITPDGLLLSCTVAEVVPAGIGTL